MAKKVRLVVPTEVVVRDSDMRLLHLVDLRSASRRRGATLSSQQMADGLGVSSATAHRTVRSCADRGYLTVQSNRRDNGAQVANSYQLTSEGMVVLTAARDAGVVD